jgi:FkbM family methyltransferase
MKVTTILPYLQNRLNYIKNRLLLSPSIKESQNGLKYYITPGSSLDYIIEKNGVLDDWFCLQHLQEIIPPNGTIIDIGANVGYLSLPFAKELVPQGNVFCYEPDPENMKRLQKNIKINDLKNITTCATALQNEPSIETISFNIRRTIDGDGNENRGLSSLMTLEKFTKNKISVQASTIDQELKRHNIKAVHFIKIDVEGAEFLVLEGAALTLAKDKPIIQYEYSNILDKMMHENNTEKVFRLLQKLGYRQFCVDSNNNVTELTSPDDEMADMNVVCFPDNKIPSFFTKK